VTVALEVVTRQGPWSLVRAVDSQPQWVGWVHRDASAWRDEVVRLVRAGALAQVTAAIGSPTNPVTVVSSAVSLTYTTSPTATSRS
jgi:hypothetical protein